MMQWDHWHIELSSICTLKCPRCPRLEVADTLLNKQLSLEFFKNQIGRETIANIKKITFCGNDGDPIYCRDFIDICAWIKSINSQLQLVIVTNASYKDSTWWHSLANILNEHDEVHWSLDGWDQASNSVYRVNCDWASIQDGINTFFEYNNSTYRVWDAIAFKFNENMLDTMRNTAKSRGFDMFQLTKSTKFGSKYPDSYRDDLLEPTDSSLISSSFRFERELTRLTEKHRSSDNLKMLFVERAEQLKKTQHSGICLIGNKGVFLNSQGELFPCCWTANRYQHNNDWHTLAQSKFNLNNRTFTEIQQDSFWNTDFLRFDSLECTTKCTRDKLNDISHVSEW